MEIAAALDWYEAERPGLGVELASELERVFRDLLTRPEAWPLWRKQYPYRKRPMERFPYVIFYRVTDTEIRIVAVAHAKRRPGIGCAENSSGESRRLAHDLLFVAISDIEVRRCREPWRHF